MAGSNLIANLVDRVQRRADRVDSNYRVRTLDALDEAVQWYAKAVPWPSLMRFEQFLTHGSEFIVLPDRVLKVISIGDVTNSSMLEPGSNFGRRRRGAYFQRTGGRLCEWRDVGLVPVTSQPNTDTTLIFQSTASDNAFDVFVKGLVRDTTASGTALELYEVEETVSISSTATVASSNSFVRVLALQKPRPTNGDLTVTYTTGDQRAARLPSWEARPLYPQIQLSLVPSVQATLEVEYFRRPDRLVSENGAIDPSMDEEALIWRAVGNMHWKDQEGQQAETAWRKAVEIVESKKNVEETFGEKDFHVEPFSPGYFDQEGLNDWTGTWF